MKIQCQSTYRISNTLMMATKAAIVTCVPQLFQNYQALSWSLDHNSSITITPQIICSVDLLINDTMIYSCNQMSHMMSHQQQERRKCEKSLSHMGKNYILKTYIMQRNFLGFNQAFNFESPLSINHPLNLQC